MEQGIALTSEQSIRDQTSPEAGGSVEDGRVGEGDDLEEDPNIAFAEEHPGKWRGYIEWEDYPEKRRKVAEILARHKFPPPPEFQLATLE